MRLIDADALKSEVKRWFASYANRERMQEAIDNAPTLDYAPGVHGKWLRANKEQFYFDVEYTCSECGFTVAVSGIGTPLLYGYNYCPHCRTWMDGKGDGKDENT